MLNIQYLVVGCGRSGTTFIAETFKKSGLNAEHECAFDLNGINPNALNTIECSWYAVPYLPVLSQDIKIIHLFRHPQKVVSSFYKFGIFSNNTFRHASKGKCGKFLFRLIAHPSDAWPRICFAWRHKEFLSRSLNIHDWRLNSEIEKLEQYWSRWNLDIISHCKKRHVESIVIDIDNIDESKEKIERFLGCDIIINKETDRNIKKDYRKRPLPVGWQPSSETLNVWYKMKEMEREQ